MITPYPKSFEIRSFIDLDLFAVQYASFHGVIDMTAKLGPIAIPV